MGEGAETLYGYILQVFDEDETGKAKLPFIYVIFAKMQLSEL